MFQGQKKVIRFLWSSQGQPKRHRAAKAFPIFRKAKGGLGLISVHQQATALIGPSMRGHFRRLTERRWGSEDYTWAFAQSHTWPRQGSASGLD